MSATIKIKRRFASLLTLETTALDDKDTKTNLFSTNRLMHSKLEDHLVLTGKTNIRLASISLLDNEMFEENETDLELNNDLTQNELTRLHKLL